MKGRLQLLICGRGQRNLEKGPLCGQVEGGASLFEKKKKKKKKQLSSSIQSVFLAFQVLLILCWNFQRNPHRPLRDRKGKIRWTGGSGIKGLHLFAL
jgi:hypothetical protein